MTRQALDSVLNGRSGISAELAVRLDKAFGGGAEVWLRLQMAWDLTEVRKRAKSIQVRRVRVPGTETGIRG